jgi:hypothetical protein
MFAVPPARRRKCAAGLNSVLYWPAIFACNHYRCMMHFLRSGKRDVID